MDRPKKRSPGNAAGRLHELLARYVEQAALDKPYCNVPTPVASLQAPDPAGRKEDGPSCFGQILSDLTT